MTNGERAVLAAKGLTGVRLSCQIVCDHDMAVRAISRLAGSGRKDVGPRPADTIPPDATKTVFQTSRAGRADSRGLCPRGPPMICPNCAAPCLAEDGATTTTAASRFSDRGARRSRSSVVVRYRGHARDPVGVAGRSDSSRAPHPSRPLVACAPSRSPSRGLRVRADGLG